MGYDDDHEHAIEWPQAVLKKVDKFQGAAGLKVSTIVSKYVDTGLRDTIHVPTCQGIIPIPGDQNNVLFLMPLLRRFDDPPFETVGEAVEFFRQIFEVCAEVDIPGHLIYLLPFTGLALHARTGYRSWVCLSTLLVGVVGSRADLAR